MNSWNAHNFQPKGSLDREQEQTGVLSENCHYYDGCYYCGKPKEGHEEIREPSTFEKQLQEKVELYRKKNADYTGGVSTYFNFEMTGHLIAPLVRDGVNPVDVVFLVQEGIKLSRLIALKRSGKPPENESVLDSHTDFSNYAEIWEAYQRDIAKAPPAATVVIAQHDENSIDAFAVGFESYEAFRSAVRRYFVERDRPL